MALNVLLKKRIHIERDTQTDRQTKREGRELTRLPLANGCNATDDATTDCNFFFMLSFTVK